MKNKFVIFAIVFTFVVLFFGVSAVSADDVADDERTTSAMTTGTATSSSAARETTTATTSKLNNNSESDTAAVIDVSGTTIDAGIITDAETTTIPEYGKTNTFTGKYLMIKNNSGEITLNYRDKLRLTAVAGNIEYNHHIVWYIDGVKSFTCGYGVSSSTIITKQLKDDAVIEAVVENEDGEIQFYKNYNTTENITVKSGIWQIIIATIRYDILGKQSIKENDKYEITTDDSDNIPTTIVTTIKTVTKKTVVTRSATTTKKGQTTTKKATTTSNATAGGTTAPQAVSNGSGGGIIEEATTDAEQSLTGYKYSSGGYYYCDDKDNWQKYTGYNEVYDKWAGTMGMFIDQVRVRFEYENKGWMVQLWKGQYGFILIGAEIGLYTCDIDDYDLNSTDYHRYNAADQSDWLNMSLTMYYRAKGDTGAFKPMFSRPYTKYWWCTGFVKGQLSKYTAPRTELKTLNRITFKTTEMADIYVNQLSDLGFGRAVSSSALSDDTYAQNGADVYVLWSSIYNDNFSGSM